MIQRAEGINLSRSVMRYMLLGNIKISVSIMVTTLCKRQIDYFMIKVLSKKTRSIVYQSCQCYNKKMYFHSVAYERNVLVLLQQRFVRFSLIVLLSMPYCKQIVCCSERESHTVLTATGPITKVSCNGVESYETYICGRSLFVSRSASGEIFAGSFDSDGGCFFLNKSHFLTLKAAYEERMKNGETKTAAQVDKVCGADGNKKW